MSSTYYNKRKRPIVITVIILVVILIITKITTSKNSGKNFGEVLQNIPNESILGLSNLITNENEKSQDEFLTKLEKMNSKFFQLQDERLKKLERQNELLLEQIKLLKNPPQQSSLREKLVYLYPYDPTVKFPAYIWQTWKHGLNDERFDELYREGESQWAWKNPGFVHELFNDDTSHTMIKHLFKQIPEVIEAFESLPEVILRMDFFRYLILFAKGGVYSDIDTYPLQPIPNWIPENVLPDELGMIISIDTDSSSPDWKSESVRRLQFCQFVIQAKPGHPILREIIANIVEDTLARKSELMSNEQLRLTGSSNQRSLEISKWTGSGKWTDMVMRYFNDYLQSSIFQKITWKEFHDLKIPKLVSDILVLPVHSFASEIEIPKDGKIDDPLAFVKHYSAKIWKTT
ncbi:glycosyltransferase family 32 protein [Suhomyces tanzawaensis NRRL Y-17324]|uniref:Glycosyltransferase family 32 protein n=1 Tax=Suhomyces tanzawaensis NRRL Y-17324 TaxID=984487 RepID=A0A1E4SQQ8_9ASCO|nr:glycosyltransferase family 32 protein [Suhomyces tanzawaensis NRRL Y-17324]ODV81846.1 glycosyltransferase family 32 protein [Suhomyces tanzawaensis NRRL Y-17324]